MNHHEKVERINRINKDLDRILKKTESKFDKIKLISDIELQAEFSKYLCILSSGFFEECIKLVFEKYSVNHGDERILKFIIKQFKHRTNFTDKKIAELLDEFSAEWGSEYRILRDDSQAEALNSIYTNRNLIAHGKDSGISYAALKPYYEAIKRLVKTVDIIINKE